MKRRYALLLAAVLQVFAGCNGEAWSSGDRVLVGKCLYETEVPYTQPRRFDVVVFKYPKGPMENGSPKNYIKRLFGLPGQILAIFFGQIYCWQPQDGERSPYEDDLKNPAINRNDLWHDEYMHINDEKSQKLFEEGKFEVVRKPPAVIKALRRIVYDNDFQAKDLGLEFKRWNPAATAGSRWSAENDFRDFRHPGDGKDIDWLRYQHLIRQEAAPGQKIKPQLITDFEAYNTFILQNAGSQSKYPNWVGDLMLECKLTVDRADGFFYMELSKGINRFRARFDLAKGLCTLFRHGPADKKDEWHEMDERSTVVNRPGTYDLTFANFDAQLTVWANRELVFRTDKNSGKTYDPPEIRGKKDKEGEAEKRRGPTENDLEPASLGSQGATAQIRNIRLWRDTYYTLSPDADDTRLREQDLSDPQAWEEIRKLRYKTMYVQPGHYLCLGDNSPASADSRHWGLVPERLMLGRALLVYYPVDRAGPIR